MTATEETLNALSAAALAADATAWEDSINQLAADDDDMAAYIGSLEQARDAVDSPSASGEAIAEEFERFLRKKDDEGDVSTPRPGE